MRKEEPPRLPKCWKDPLGVPFEERKDISSQCPKDAQACANSGILCAKNAYLCAITANPLMNGTYVLLGNRLCEKNGDTDRLEDIAVKLGVSRRSLDKIRFVIRHAHPTDLEAALTGALSLDDAIDRAMAEKEMNLAFEGKGKSDGSPSVNLLALLRNQLENPKIRLLQERDANKYLLAATLLGLSKSFHACGDLTTDEYRCFENIATEKWVSLKNPWMATQSQLCLNDDLVLRGSWPGREGNSGRMGCNASPDRAWLADRGRSQSSRRADPPVPWVCRAP